MPQTVQPKRYAPVDLDNNNIAAGAGIVSSKLADGANFIKKDGSVAFTGDVSIGNSRITNVATPSTGTDAANRNYVDTQITNLQGLFAQKGSARVATTANITLSGTQTIDGIAVVAGDRVLVKNQTIAADNGIYVVAAGAWTRATDMDLWAEVPGAWLTIQQGTTQADTFWISTADQGGTLGTTAITFTNPISVGGLTQANFVTEEAPSGTINGSNVTFTLANTPISGSVILHISGYRLRPGAGNDYTITGSTITMSVAPLTGEYLVADYRK